uniref:Secreted protein n=1 Tax=Anguilla anguilla TaxID=7936 RepID=A0A0E9XW99_ANGAN
MPHRVWELCISFWASCCFRGCWSTPHTPDQPSTHGRLRNTSSPMPCMPLTRVETGWTLLRFLRMDCVRPPTLSPMAQEVYPFSRMTS